MRIAIFTNRDLASNYNLNLLLPRIGHRVVQIFVSDKVGGSNTNPPRALRELKFFEQELPNDILFPQLDAQDRNLDSGKLLTFNELSKKYNIPLQSLNDVRSEESLNLIAGLQLDLVISVRYGKIFDKSFLRLPRLGVINLHSGLLPQYRGVLAVFRALAQGDERISSTLHYIEDGTIDTGGIIDFSHLTVEPGRSLLWHILHLYPASTDMLVSAVERIAAGEKPLAAAQSTEGAAYFSFPTQEEVEGFEQNGGRFVEVRDYSEIIRRYC